MTSITKWLSGTLAAFEIFTGTPQVLAEAPKQCTIIENEHQESLEGTFWGCYGNGALDNFSKDNSNKPELRKSFQDIAEYLAETRRTGCTNSERRDRALEKLIENIFIEDPTIRTSLRTVLEKEGILNYETQLEDLVGQAEELQTELVKIEREVKKHGCSSKSKSFLEDKVNRYRDHLLDLRIMSTFVVDQAFYLRDRLSGSSIPIIDEDVSEAINAAKKARDHTKVLQGKLDSKSYLAAYQEFKKWKPAMRDMFGSMLKTLDDGMNYGLIELSKGRWGKIAYKDSKGEWKQTLVTPEFQNFWTTADKRLSVIDDAISETDRFLVKLGDYERIPSRKTAKGKTEVVRTAPKQTYEDKKVPGKVIRHPTKVISTSPPNRYLPKSMSYVRFGMGLEEILNLRKCKLRAHLCGENLSDVALGELIDLVSAHKSSYNQDKTSHLKKMLIDNNIRRRITYEFSRDTLFKVRISFTDPYKCKVLSDFGNQVVDLASKTFGPPTNKVSAGKRYPNTPVQEYNWAGWDLKSNDQNFSVTISTSDKNKKRICFVSYEVINYKPRKSSK